MQDKLSLIQLNELENQLLELALNEEITEEDFYSAVEQLGIKREEKGITYIKVLEKFNINIEQGKAYIKSLQERLKFMEKRQERIKNNILYVMENLKIDKLETPLGTIKYNAGRDSVDVQNIDDIPKQFITIEHTYKVDKKAILKHLKDTGEIVEGVDIIQKPYITIK